MKSITMKVTKAIVFLGVVGAIGSVVIMSGGSDQARTSVTGNESSTPDKGVAAQAVYLDIDATTLDSWLRTEEGDEEIFLLDTHIPEQEHIPATDAFIPFDEIEGHLGDLPTDKETKIVVYCRSGNMSREASQTLIDLGYTNVYNLLGGIKAYNSL